VELIGDVKYALPILKRNASCNATHMLNSLRLLACNAIAKKELIVERDSETYVMLKIKKLLRLRPCPIETTAEGSKKSKSLN